jgi:hypothetical protein
MGLGLTDYQFWVISVVQSFKNIKSKDISETGSISFVCWPLLSRFLPLFTLTTDTDLESETFLL